MTHALSPRAVRTSLSLLTLLACGTPPVLTAARPSPACARPLPPDTDGRPADPPWPFLGLPNASATPLGPFLAADPFAPDAGPPPRLFIEEAAAQLRDADGRATKRSDGGYALGDTDPSRATPLFLSNWSATDPGSSHGLRLDGVQRVAQSTTDGDWGALTSKVKLRERDDPLDPSLRNAWETGETLRVPVAGPLFLFGQLDASSPSIEQQQHKWLGKTGVGVRIKPWLLQEVQVRGGPAVRTDDTVKERSELFLEAVTKLPLPVVGPLNVEYTSYAVPAVTPADRNQINQDVKLAVPLGGGGQFHVGAKYRWENAPAATPWVERAQLYLGVQLKR